MSQSNSNDDDDFDWTFGFDGPGEEAVPAYPVMIQQDQFGRRVAVDAKTADADNRFARQREVYVARNERKNAKRRRVQ